MTAFGYSSDQGWGVGYSLNGNTNMYYPGYNYNAPEQATAKAYDKTVQTASWTFYIGLGASAASEVYFSKNFGTWMGKNLNIYMIKNGVAMAQPEENSNLPKRLVINYR
jgi:hypothetical protein